MHWEFALDKPLTVHTLREILDILPEDAPICLAMANDRDSEPASGIDFELAVRVGQYWACGTDDPVDEKSAILTIRA